MAEAETARIIVALIEAVDQLIGNFLSDPVAALQLLVSQLSPLPTVVENALRDAGYGSSAIDLRALSSRLRAMLYSTLEQKGQGSFSTVFRVSILLSMAASPLSFRVPTHWHPLCCTRLSSQERSC